MTTTAATEALVQGYEQQVFEQLVRHVELYGGGGSIDRFASGAGAFAGVLDYLNWGVAGEEQMVRQAAAARAFRRFFDYVIDAVEPSADGVK